VERGDAHIIITMHMDLRTLELSELCPDGGCSQLVYFKVQNGTLSITVRLHVVAAQVTVGSC
jgi:hypothetical protein